MSALDDRTILRQTATRVLDAHGLVLEDVQVRHGSGAPEVRLIVDLPEHRLGSADLDTVAAASRELSELVDADDALLGPDPVVLEVTTPGADRPLTAPRHFRRSRGRLLSLTAADGIAYRARLLAVDGELLRLRQEPGRDDRGRPLKRPAGTSEQLELPIAEVTAARIEIEFDPPADLPQLLADLEATAADPADPAEPTDAAAHPAADTTAAAHPAAADTTAAAHPAASKES